MRETDRQTDRQRQTERERERQTDRGRERQRERQRERGVAGVEWFVGPSPHTPRTRELKKLHRLSYR